MRKNKDINNFVEEQIRDLLGDPVVPSSVEVVSIHVFGMAPNTTACTCLGQFVTRDDAMACIVKAVQQRYCGISALEQFEVIT